MEVSTMFYKCTYCVSTLYGRTTDLFEESFTKIETLNILKGHWTSLTSFFIFFLYLILYGGFKWNQYPNFQLILPMPFHFMTYSMSIIIFRVSLRLLVYQIDFEKCKMLEIFLFLQNKVNLQHHKTPWGYSNYFSTGCAARGLKTLTHFQGFFSL